MHVLYISVCVLELRHVLEFRHGIATSICALTLFHVNVTRQSINHVVYTCFKEETMSQVDHH